MVIYLKATKTKTKELYLTKSSVVWAERQNKATFSKVGHNSKGNMYLSYNRDNAGQNIRDLHFATYP